MKKRVMNMNSEVRILESRVRATEAVQRMVLTVQLEEMQRAEKLRKLVIALIESRGISTDRRRASVSASAMGRLEAFLPELTRPFYRKRRIPSAVRKFMEKR